MKSFIKDAVSLEKVMQTQKQKTKTGMSIQATVNSALARRMPQAPQGGMIQRLGGNKIMITHEHILNNISELKSLDNGRKRKYWRNYRWYNFTKTTDIENVRNPSVIGLYNIDESPETDTTETP